MKEIKIAFDYEGSQDEAQMERDLDVFMAEHGYQRDGSGVNFISRRRDITYTKECEAACEKP